MRSLQTVAVQPLINRMNCGVSVRPGFRGLQILISTLASVSPGVPQVSYAVRSLSDHLLWCLTDRISNGCRTVWRWNGFVFHGVTGYPGLSKRISGRCVTRENYSFRRNNTRCPHTLQQIIWKFGKIFHWTGKAGCKV